MRKKHMICKRILAVCLAASMVFSGSITAGAAGTAKTGEASSELSTAADGTPSKVIGLEVKPSCTSIRDTNNNILATYSYTNLGIDTRTAYLPGKVAVYKDAVTGLYAYNGVYYKFGYNFQSGGNDFCYLYYPVTFCDGVRDDATGLYAVNGKYYSSYNMTSDGRYYVYPDYEVVILGSYPNDDTFKAAHGVKLDPANDAYNYYQKDGRTFTAYGKNYVAKDNYTYYLRVSSEIFLNAAKMNISWNSVSVGENYVTSDNKLIQAAYEIEVNGTSYPCRSIITAEGMNLQGYTSLTSDYPILKAGESATVRVRAVYYTATETVNGEGKNVTVYNTYKKGPWSDPYIYTYNGLTTKEILALSVTAVQDEDVIKVDWNRNNDVKEYRLQYIYSNTPINVTAENWNDYYRSSGDAWDAVTAANPNQKHEYGSSTTSKTQMKRTWNKDMPYCYFVVVPASLTKEYDTFSYVYSNVAAVAAVPKGINTPAISGFKVATSTNGTDFTFTWTPVNANMIIYAYEKSAFPAYYNYNKLDAYAEVLDAEGKTNKKNLKDAIDITTKAIIDREVRVYTVDGKSGTCSWSTLEAGKKWYFVAHTYDETDRDVAKAAPVAVIDNIAYNFYTAMGPATNVVSAKITVSKPNVYTLSGKTSIKLSMSNGSTGFEIYRKSGKKWKKLATTVDNHYIDEGLKEKKEYSYRVRSFYLNEDTNVKAYSDYTYVQATTGTVNTIMLTAAAKSSKSIKLSWTKVSGVTKYEIYRADEVSGDFSEYYGKYSTVNGDTWLSNNKYELVKTIKKASTTSWTDKSVKAGEDYTYFIKASYENGKKISFIYDMASVSMQMGTPKMVKTVNKGTSVKVSWAKDPYAKKYEVAYMKYDAEGETDAKAYTYKTTTKTAYTIKNVEKGGYVAVKVRAIGKNGRYSSWSNVTQGVGLASAKKVKASNVTVKNTAGKKMPAVKITWQKVSGAAYYRVYRSTKKPGYYADRKMYSASGSLIAKESNNDTGSYDEVYYDDVQGISGSIIGTSAIDAAQLKTGVDYYYTVVAFGPTGTELASYASYKNSSGTISKTYGSGSYSKICFNTKLTVTAKVSKGKVKLTWNKIPGATKYTIYRATSKKGKYTKVATVKKGKVTWTDKKAKKGKTYYYKVVATGKNFYKNPFEATSSAKKVKAK